jgi:tetratricopeptide (TPR) repeat protein
MDANPEADDPVDAESNEADAAPPRRMHGLHYGFFAFMAALVALVMVLFVLWNLDRAKHREDHWRNPEQFVRNQPDMRPRGVPELGLDGAARLLSKFSAAVRERNEKTIADFLDTNRFAAQTTSYLPDPTAARKGAGALGKRFVRWLVDHASEFAGPCDHVLAFESQDDGTLLVGAPFKGPRGSFYATLWLVEGGGGWKICDIEPALGIRASIDAADALVVDNLGDAGRTAAGPLRSLGEAQAALVAVPPDAVKALRILDGIGKADLVPSAEGTRQFLRAMALRANGRLDDALEATQKCEAAEPKRQGTSLLMGLVFHDLGRDREAKDCLYQFHIRALSWLSLRTYADAVANVKEIDSIAPGAYRKALDDRPDDPETFLRFLQRLGNNYYPETDIGKRFARLSKPGDIFAACADDRAAKKDSRSLQQISDEMCRIDPKLPAAWFYRALAEATVESPATSVATFRKYAALETDANLVDQRRGRLAGVLGKRGALEAYDLGGAAAFRELADELEKRNPSALRHLIRKHAEKHPDDPDLLLQRGKLLAAEGKYAEADKDLTRAAAKLSAAELRAVRSLRIEARYRIGKGATVLDDFDEPDWALQELSGLCVADRKLDLLSDLIERWEKKHTGPDRDSMPRIELYIAQGKIAEAVDLHRKRLALVAEEMKKSTKPGDPPPIYDVEFVAGQFYDRMTSEGHPLEAYRAATDRRAAFARIADDLVRQWDWDELGRLIDAHAADHPTDRALAHFRGRKFRHERQWSKAADAFTEGVNANLVGPINYEPEAGHRSEILYCRYRAGESLRAFRELRPHEETLHMLVDLAVRDRDLPLLRGLLEAQGKIDRNDPAYSATLARLHTLENHVDAAKRLADEVPYYWKSPLHRNLENDLVFLGRPVEACTTSKLWDYESGDQLGRYLIRRGDVDSLERLLECKQMHSYYRKLFEAYVPLLRGRYDEAERTFREVIEIRDAGWLRERILYRQGRNGLFKVAVERGQATELLREFEKDDDAFRALARICVQRDKPEQLAAILDVERKDPDADPIEVEGFEIELRWLRKDYAGVLARLDADEGLMALDKFAEKQSLRVRSLVRLGRFAEAADAAKLTQRPRGFDWWARKFPVLSMLTVAAQGDVERTIAFADRYIRYDADALVCYKDADVGPILASDRFAPFRARFPRPVEYEWRTYGSDE